VHTGFGQIHYRSLGILAGLNGQNPVPPHPVDFPVRFMIRNRAKISGGIVFLTGNLTAFTADTFIEICNDS
jgi:hypothetical protein